MKAQKPKGDQPVPVRMPEELKSELIEYGRRTNIGSLSAVIRFACTTFLQDQRNRAFPKAS